MNRDTIYIFTRLFSPEDRRFSAEVERLILAKLKSLAIKGVKTFLPYRDSNQGTVVTANKAKYIYDADVQNLQRSIALIGFLNGLAKDEGICFEIGYAFATGVPTIVGITDFFKIQVPHSK